MIVEDSFSENAAFTVARYAILRLVEKKYPDDGWVCGNAMDHCFERGARRIRRVFTKEAIELMAYYIRLHNEEISNEEYEEKISQYTQFVKGDISRLVDCACMLSYSISGLSLKVRRSYLHHLEKGENI